MYSKRISIFTGHFGSGKTEVAVNYALKLNEKGYKTVIADLDIVNPYFRTFDAKKYLESQGISTIAPIYANTNVDVPALPAEINSLFENKKIKVVIDVGGDELGALAISRYKEDILGENFQHLFVLNIKRPMTNTIEQVEEMFYNIEEGSGVKVTGIVNNTNLLEKTSIEDVLKGYEISEAVGKKVGVPVVFTSGLSGVLEKINIAKYGKRLGDIFDMKKMIRLPWEI